MPCPSFMILHQLTVNLGKTKVMIFNGTKIVLSKYHFYFQGVEIEITATYTYLGVQFSRPRFGLRKALQPRINKGYGSLAVLERQCFQNHFQNIRSKMDLMDNLIIPTILYGSEVWRLNLLEMGQAITKRVWFLMLHRIIKCRRTIPQAIIQAEFATSPFRIETIFGLVSLLHHVRRFVRRFVDSSRYRDHYSQLEYHSSKTIAISNTSN